jgi:hypothetical protein
MLTGRKHSVGFRDGRAKMAWLAAYRPAAIAVLSLMITSMLTCANTAAQVETWYEPTNSLTGSVAGARFGSSVSCAVVTDGLPSFEPYIAVGAPDEDNGAGAVYIYKTKDITAPPQRLTSPDPGAGKGFGTALTFAPRVGDSGFPWLIVTEPNANGSSAKIYLFETGDPAGSPYVISQDENGPTQATLPAGSGDSIASLGVIQDGFTLSVFAVGSSARGAVESFHIYLSFNGLARQIVSNSYFSSIGLPNSGYGFSLSSYFVPGTEQTGLLIGAPSTNSLAGSAELQERGDITNGGGAHSILRSGLANELLGIGVAGDSTTRYSAFSGPGSQKLYVNHNSVNMCSISMPLGQGGSQSLAYAPFLTDGIDAEFAVYRAESQTGGSVGLIRVNGATCSSPRPYNNCILDQGQEQGSVLAQKDCWGKKSDGTIAPALLVGAPGWQGEKGRVDLIVKGSELPTAKVCSGTEPMPTPTPTPTANNRLPGETPVLIQPGQVGLPAPKVEATLGSPIIKLTFPPVQLRDPQMFRKLLQRRFRISSRRARRIMAAGSVNFLYEAEVAVTTAARARSSVKALTDLLIPDAEASPSRKVQMIQTRNRTTSLRVETGASLEVRYRVIIQVSGQRKDFATKFSAVTRART